MMVCERWMVVNDGYMMVNAGYITVHSCQIMAFDGYMALKLSLNGGW